LQIVEDIMRRGRIFFYLALIVILGMVVFVVLWQKYLQPSAAASSAQGSPSPVVETTDVVVVAQRVPRGNILDETVLSVVPMQKDLVLQGMFNNVNDVIGRQVKFDLEAGIPLTSGMLVNSTDQLSSTGSNAALSIPRGMVAVSIPTDQLSSVSYAPQAGDHVNLIITLKFVDLDPDFQSILPNKTRSVVAPGPALEGSVGGMTADISGEGGVQGRADVDPVLGQTLYVVPSEAQRPRMASQTLLQDVVVLRMGEFPSTAETQAQSAGAAPTEVPAGEEETPPPAPVKPSIATLIVSPQDAVTINYLVNLGAEMTMALRATGDDSRVDTEAVTLQFLMDQYRIPVPVKLPYGIDQPSSDSSATPTETP
jgi:pilus assembly protein CpaB